jgi:glycosyltransferase involved in cell wall biosynthesis
LILNMAKQRGRYLFHIVGGLEDDISYWKKRASKMNLDNVIFEGYMSHSKVTALRKKFDILLAPYEQKVRISGNTGDTSKWMSPLKIFEYMSDKKPILVSDLPVLHEVLKDKYSCLFCKVNDLTDWLEKLDILIGDKEFSCSISNNAYDTLKEYYTWDKRANLVIDKI